MSNQLNPSNPMVNQQMTQRILELMGHESHVASEVMYGSKNAPSARDTGNVDWSDPKMNEYLISLSNSNAMVEGLRSTVPAFADTVDQRQLSDALHGMPDRGIWLDDLRAGYRDLRTNSSITLTQVANDPAPLTERIKHWGGDMMQILGGAAEPLGRPQQFVYGLLSGEDLGTAWRRMVPQTVVDPDTGKEITPFAAAWDAITEGGDEWDNNIETLRRANQEQGKELITFMDLPDAWFGEGSMDNFYAHLDQNGLPGQFGMAVLSSLYAAGEMFVDPLIIFEAAPVAAAKGLRKLPSTAAKAARTAEIASKTDTARDLADAVTAATEHYYKAAAMHRRENSMQSAQRLKQAMRNLLERQDDLNAHAVLGESDTFYQSVPRGNPKNYETREVADRIYQVNRAEKPVKLSRTRRDIVRELRARVDQLEGFRRIGILDPADEPKFVEKINALETELEYWDTYRRRPDNMVAGDQAAIDANAKKLYDDLLEIRQKLVEDRDALGGKGSAAISKEIDRIDEFITAIENGRQGSIPPHLEFTSKYRRTRTADELKAEILADERDANAASTRVFQPNRDDQYNLFVDDPDGLEVLDRQVGGADDAEFAAEGLGRLSAGDNYRNLTTPLVLTPERQALTGGRIVPGVTTKGTIDLDYTKAKFAKMARENEKKAWVWRGKGPEGWEGKRIKQGDLLEEAKKIVEKGEQYDESWLPQPRKTAKELMEEGWYEEYGKSFWDRVSPALYGTYRIPIPQALKAAVYPLREPMRVYGEVDPQSWEILRSAMMNSETETARLNAVFRHEMQRFGAMTEEQLPAFRRAIETDAPPVRSVDADNNRLLFRILDTDPDTERIKYAKLTEGLTADQMQAVNNIRNELDIIASRLGITGTKKMIRGYMPHAFDKDWFAKGGFPPTHNGLSQNGKVWLRNLMDRGGEVDYIEDAAAVLDLYSRGVSRKLHLEPAFGALKKRTEFVVGNDPRKGWLATYTDMTIAQIKGEPSLMGRVLDRVVGDMQSALGRRYMPGDASRKLMAINSLLYASLLAGNRRYPIMSIATSLTTTAAEFGTWRTVKALFAMATPEGQAISKAAGITRMWDKIFEEGSAMTKLTRVAAGGRPFGMSIQDTETFIRGMGFWASVDESLTKMGYRNIHEAMEDGMHSKVLYDAVRRTEEVNHFFGVGAKPPVFSRISKSGSALGTQFLSFGPKQTEQLLSMARRDPSKIAQYMMLSGWITRVAAQEMGIDMTDYVGLGYLKDYGTRGITSPGVNVALKMLDMSTELSKMLLGDGDPVAAQKAVDAMLQEMENFLPYFNGMRSYVRTEEALRTGEQRTPGEGGGRPINLELGEKGDRGELYAQLTGMRSMEQSAYEDARNKIFHARQTAALERMALVEKAFQATRTGDNVEVRKQLKRMKEMGFPIGDLADAVRNKKEAEALYWYYSEILKDKNMLHKVVPIMQEYGILER